MNQLSIDDLQSLRSSFAAILANSDAFAAALYRRLFDRAPAVRNLFSRDMEQQREKLIATLALVVKHSDQLDSLNDSVIALGRRHVDYGVQPAHYDVLRDVFIETLEEFFGNDLTPEVKSAWAKLYDSIAAKMLEHS